MTTSIRYVKNTTTAANVDTNVASTGGDYQLVAFDIITTAGIAAGANANILTWKGAGKIKSILTFTPKVAATGELLPLGIAAQNTHTLITIDASQKILNVSVPGAGVPIPALSVMAMLLVIGNY